MLAEHILRARYFAGDVCRAKIRIGHILMELVSGFYGIRHKSYGSASANSVTLSHMASGKWTVVNLPLNRGNKLLLFLLPHSRCGWKMATALVFIALCSREWRGRRAKGILVKFVLYWKSFPEISISTFCLHLIGQCYVPIPSWKEGWEFNHSKERLTRTKMGWAFSKLIHSLSHKLIGRQILTDNQKNEDIITGWDKGYEGNEYDSLSIYLSFWSQV